VLRPRKRLGDLAGQPLRRRMAVSPRTTAVGAGRGPAPETRTIAQGQSRNHKQTNGGDRLRVVAEEHLPAWRGRPTLHHAFRHRRLRDLKAEHQQLAMGPRCSPLWVFFAHPSDEITQLASDLWPPCPLPQFPTPERRETSTMPAKYGLRLNDMRRIEQAWPERGHPDQQGPVTAAQPKTSSSRRRGLKKSMANMVSECRSANIARDHAMILPDDATPTPDGIFGKDSPPLVSRWLLAA
jgi:hypothetical protein